MEYVFQGQGHSIDLSAFRPEYDVSSGEFVVGFSLAIVGNLLISQTCKQAGSFPAQNAFGAKVTVRRQTCERFFVNDGDVMAARVGGTRIKMTPDQFREIKKRGVRTEIDMTVGHPKHDEPVTFSDTLDEATVSDPIETRMRVWTVFGRLNEIRWILPGEKQAVLFWRKP